MKIKEFEIKQKVLNKIIELDDTTFALVFALNNLSEAIEKLRLSK